MLSPETRITSFVTGSGRAFFHKKARLEEHISPRLRLTPTELEFEEPSIAGQDHTFGVSRFERQTPDDTRSARTAVECAVAALWARKKTIFRSDASNIVSGAKKWQRATGTKPGPGASSECSTSIPFYLLDFTVRIDPQDFPAAHPERHPGRCHLFTGRSSTRCREIPARQSGLGKAPPKCRGSHQRRELPRQTLTQEVIYTIYTCKVARHDRSKRDAACFERRDSQKRERVAKRDSERDTIFSLEHKRDAAE